MAEGHHPAGAPGTAGRRRRTDADDGAVGAEQVVGVLEHHAVRVLGRPGDGQQRQRPRRCRGSRPRPRWRGRPRCAPPPHPARSRSAPRAGRRASRRGAGRAAGGTARRAAGRAPGRSASRRPAGSVRRRSRTRRGSSSSAVVVSSSASAIAVVMTRVPDVIPCARSRAGTPTTRDRSRSTFCERTKVPPPRPGTRRTAPALSSAPRACRMVERLTPSFSASSRSAPSRSPGRSSPCWIWSSSWRRTRSAAGPIETTVTHGGHGTQIPSSAAGDSGQHLAAVDHERLAGDVPRLVAGEEERGVADVVDAAETVLRDGGLHAPDVVRTHVVQPLGRDVPGHDRIDGDPSRGELDRGGAQEAELGGLAGAVVRPARVPRDRAGDRGRHDHAAPPARRERVEAGLHREHRALEVDAEHVVDVGLGQLGQRLVGEDPGVGAEHVDPAEALHGGRGHGLAVLDAGDVGRPWSRPGPRRRRPSSSAAAARAPSSRAAISTLAP